jgi:hypothetical protein
LGSRGVEGLGLAASVVAQIEMPSFVVFYGFLVDICARARHDLYSCFGKY